MRIKEFWEMKKTRYEIWNEWRKTNKNGKWHQILVLLGIRKSFSFEVLTPMKMVMNMLENLMNEMGDHYESSRDSKKVSRAVRNSRRGDKGLVSKR